MNSIARHKLTLIPTFVLALLVALFVGLGSGGHQAAAGPEVSGNPNGASERLLIQDGRGGKVKRIVYVTSGAKTMANTTPISSTAQCSNSGDLHRADVHLVGTMSGTAPTLTYLWQNSIDGGATWQNVGTFVQVNATSVATLQSQVVSDIPYAATSVVFGDCWRFTYTFGGTGTVTANFEVVGIEK